MSIDIQISLINKDLILNDLKLQDTSWSMIKNNLYKVLEYSKLPSTNNDTIIKTNTHFYIILESIIISIGLLIVISIYLRLKNKCCKIRNSTEDTIVSKLYESVNTHNRENPLSRIV
jgi:hypothetical protein